MSERPVRREEFPVGADLPPDEISRRTFVQLVGASAALAGLGACTQPAEHILPYVVQPPEITPGLATHYATAMELDGFATGLIVESHAGRPTKVEGNPLHPASLGATGAYEQASLLDLYDPHRARSIRAGTGRGSWDSFRDELTTIMRGNNGAGLALLLEPTSSPLIGDLLGRIRQSLPDARIYFHAPLSTPSPAWRDAAGRARLPQYDLQAADVVLALDGDFLGSMPFHLRYARDFAARRRISAPTDSMNRLYVVEGRPTVTGTVADHRLRVKSGDVALVLAAIAGEIADAAGEAAPAIRADVRSAIERLRQAPVAPRAWIAAVARDLRAHRGRGVVIVGERQPPIVHGLAHLVNAALGNVGRTVWSTPTPIVDAGEAPATLLDLVGTMQRGEVRTLLVLGGNPAYASPRALDFSALLRRMPTSVYVGLTENETSRDCTWMIPGLHYLEAWGDTRAYDGTRSIVQPLVRPLYGGRSVVDMLSTLVDGAAATSAYEQLRERWPADASWEEALRSGLVAASASPRAVDGPSWETLGAELEALAARAQDGRRIEITFAADPSLYDGRFAGNVWLQELPDPITKLTWDNAALTSVATARELGVENGDLVRLQLDGRTLRLPALVVPGHADGAITLHFGYGRTVPAVEEGGGFDVFELWPTSMPYFVDGASVAVDGDHYPLALTQTHWTIDPHAEGRGTETTHQHIVRWATLDEYRRHPDFTRGQRGRVLSLYEPYEYERGDQWAMTIDLSLCTGCSACVVACQAENNIPTVGKPGVLKSREMHWLRIDRYLIGEGDEADAIIEPMLCQHCEKAPCEYVCPVNATVHSPDGLNEMVYNRCVGTRFCSNNCPYKVRRFNWFDYNAEMAETVEMAKNPDVTVRDRGVMEKCTFCVQRIRGAQIEARLEQRPIRDGEVQTACQQACPTRAIVFGSRTDPSSTLVRRLAEQRRFAVLHDLGTQPRVQYLARITNPNPELA